MPDAGPYCDCDAPSERCAALRPNCYRWFDGSLPEPWWLRRPPETCVEPAAHDPVEYLDPCEPDVSSPCGWLGGPRTCGVPERGAGICDSQYLAWTTTCVDDGDCPEGMVCDVEYLAEPLPTGFCRKTCTGTGGTAECVRCDYECRPEGLCGRRIDGPELGPPCTHDCECAGWVPTIGEAAHCVGEDPVTGERRCAGGPGVEFDFCDRGDASTRCYCRGEGMCAEGCCYLPDGTIATREANPDVCTPPP